MQTVAHNMRKYLLTLLIGIIILASCQEKPEKTKKLNYQITTSDLDNFWAAYDSLKTSKDSIRTFQKLYLDKASPEFEKFIKLRDFEAKDYVDWIKATPKFWKTVRPLTMEVKEKREKFDEIYLKMDELYDNFQPPNICFAISPIRTGGTTSQGLILIGTEIASVNPKFVDISEIDGFIKKVFQNSTGDINSLIAHELVHTQQPKGDNEDSSLLSQSITEGSADFIGSLILGKLTMNKAIFEYGEENEKALWNEFKQDVKAKRALDDTDWFYNYNSNRPADLGYYLGYKITESYYKNSTDKKRAIKEILEMENAEEFLKNSKYSE